MSDDAQPVDAFEAAVDTLIDAVERSTDAYRERNIDPEHWERWRQTEAYVVDLRARLRAARYPPVTDEALEELLAELKEVGGMGPATRTRGWLTPKDFPQRLRALYAAALQQHPTGCYSREEVIQLIKRGRNSLPLADLEGNLANRILDEHDTEQEKGKP